MKNKTFICCLLIIISFIIPNNSFGFFGPKKIVVWDKTKFNINEENTKSEDFDIENIACIGGYLFIETRTYSGSYVPSQILVLSEDGKSSRPVQCRVVKKY